MQTMVTHTHLLQSKRIPVTLALSHHKGVQVSIVPLDGTCFFLTLNMAAVLRLCHNAKVM